MNTTRERQWGFLLLEFCWALASCGGLIQHIRAEHRAGLEHR